MKNALSFIKAICFTASVFCASSPWFLMAAEAGKKSTEAKASPWVTSYMLFTLAIFLGIAVISIPTKRAEKPKFDD